MTLVAWAITLLVGAPARSQPFEESRPSDDPTRNSPSATRNSDSSVQPAQFSAPAVPAPESAAPSASTFRRFRILQRSDVPYRAEILHPPEGGTVFVISGGANFIIEGLTVKGLPTEFGPLGTVDIETDRAVVWTSGMEAGGLDNVTQQSDQQLEIYLEGNIVFRQGDRTVYADRMFYDARRQMGVVLDAELLMPPPPIGDFQYQGLVRLRAGAMRQLNQSHFVAEEAILTTSRLEEPSYALGSGTVTLTDRQQPVLDPLTGQPAADFMSGEPVLAHDYQVQSEDNFLYVAGVPVFYWPTISTNLEQPSYYIDNFRVRNDSVFGFQTLVELDMFQLLGYEEIPRGVEWDLNLDYLSQRGLGVGTGVEYERDSFFQCLGPTTGWADLWAIRDHGTDNLGYLRRTIVPEKTFRGRAYWDHRQRLVGGWLDGWTAQGELGWISDRTFLEQYYEQEWDDQRDQLTGARIKRIVDNQSFSFEGNGRINQFFTQTQWLPRVDHHWLGESLLGDTTTWFEHSTASYANIGIASRPTNPTLESQWTLLPWEVDSVGNAIDARGERFTTRHELDFPFEVAPFKVVPYALGEFGHWGADLDGNDLNRAYGQAGIRASVPFWAVDPTVRDPLFNLNGLAHKVVFDVEASYAEANRSFTELPLYDPLDDVSIVEFRRQLFFSPFGGSLAGSFDPKFDPRFYAYRTGIQDWVTAPSSEIADDLSAVRFGMRHRLQTKRGAAGEERIVDWVTFDSNATWFPQADRDNFGQDIGLVDYDLRWHIGDRFSILSDGAADFFGRGLKTASVGALLNRPTRGNVYLGIRTIDGPFEANVVNGSINYRMSPKWIGSASASIDLANTGNIGQVFHLSRIGESLITTIGTNYDQSKGNFAVSFLVEPRFLPSLSLTRRTGIEVPPAGAYGLE